MATEPLTATVMSSVAMVVVVLVGAAGEAVGVVVVTSRGMTVLKGTA